MKPLAMLLSAACLAIVAVGPGFATAAEVDGTRQPLVYVTASIPVMSAVWQRQPDAYTLKIVLDRSRYPVKVQTPVRPMQAPAGTTSVTSITAEEMRKLGIVNVADALLSLVPQNYAGMPMPSMGSNGQAPASTASSGNPFSYAMVRSITSLRTVDVTYACGKTLRVAAWVLKADGTPIAQTNSACTEAGPASRFSTEVSISYAYPVADGAQAVVVVTRVDDAFYVDKLQPPGPAPVAR